MQEEINTTDFDTQFKELEERLRAEQIRKKHERMQRAFQEGSILYADFIALPHSIRKLYTSLWPRPSSPEEIAAQKRREKAAKDKKKRAKLARKRSRRS